MKIDIVDRLRFDAARCEATFSKGVARNIEEAADEIERLTAENERLRAALTKIGFYDGFMDKEAATTMLVEARSALNRLNQQTARNEG